MSLFFFNVILLAGLAALAIPVALHFFLKGRVKRMRFSSVQFLMTDSQHQGFLHKLRNILLLLTRMALIAILVLAFARPYQEATSSSPPQGPVYMAFVLDTTASMQAGGTSGEWRSIKDFIIEKAQSLNARDRAALLTCSSGDPVRLPWSAPQALFDVVKEIEPGSQSTPLVRPLESALQLFDPRETNREKSILYLISDFQDAALNGIGRMDIPEDIEVRLVSMPQAMNSNVQVGVQSLESTGNGRCVVELKNMDATPKNRLRAALYLDGRKAGEQTVDLGPYQRQWTTFSLPNLEPGRHVLKAELAIEDGFAFDNVFYASVRVEEKIQVICLSEESGGGLEHPLFYLENAWDPTRQDGEAGSSPFAFQRMTPSLAMGFLNQSKDTSSPAIVVVPGLKHIPSGLGGALKRHAVRGGGVLFFAGEHGWPSDYNDAFKDVLPARFGRVIHAGESLEGPVRIRNLNRDHPALTPFRNPESGDLASILFRAWRELPPSEGAEVVAEFDNGTSAILHRSVGKGHAVLINHSCGAEWSDWPKERTFLPMIHGLGHFLARQNGEKAAPFHFAGEPIGVVSSEVASEGLQTLTGPDGESVRQRSDSAGRSVWQLDQAGVYEWRSSGSEVDWIAVNSARDESSVAFLSTDMAEKLLKRAEAAPADPGTFFGVPADKKEFYRWLLTMGLVLLTAELFISNRFAY